MEDAYRGEWNCNRIVRENMIHFYKPQMEDLWFRQEMLSDAETMGYNHAWGGTISFPEERWAGWYTKWLGGSKNYFYRYLAEENGTFVGEAAYHYDTARGINLCDVIVHAKYRGRGYGRRGLCLLCDAARANGLTELYDDIAVDNPAIKLFLNCGFFVVCESDESTIVKKTL